jgi:hypothetical protein
MSDTEMNTPPDPPPGRRSAFEWSLAALRPADADVARPSFMFKAGQESRNKVVRFWRCVAGGLVVVLATGAVATFGILQNSEQRVMAVRAEMQARPVPVIAPTVPTLPTTPATEPAPSENASVSVRAVTRATPRADDTPAGEIAAALERRRNILVGGLGLIPDAPPELPKAAPTYPGVFAAPRVQKKPTPPTEPETEDRPPN